MLERALTIKEYHYGSDDPEVAITLGNLANALGDLGNTIERKRLLERTLTIFKHHHYSPDHSDVTSMLVNLALAENELNNPQQGLILAKRALQNITNFPGSGGSRPHPLAKRIQAIVAQLELICLLASINQTQPANQQLTLDDLVTRMEAGQLSNMVATPLPVDPFYIHQANQYLDQGNITDAIISLAQAIKAADTTATLTQQESANAQSTPDSKPNTTPSTAYQPQSLPKLDDTCSTLSPPPPKRETLSKNTQEESDMGNDYNTKAFHP